MYHLFQNSIWKVVKIAKTSDWNSAVCIHTSVSVYTIGDSLVPKNEWFFKNSVSFYFKTNQQPKEAHLHFWRMLKNLALNKEAPMVSHCGVNRVKKLGQQNLVVKRRDVDTDIFFPINHKKRQSPFFPLRTIFLFIK